MVVDTYVAIYNHPSCAANAVQYPSGKRLHEHLLDNHSVDRVRAVLYGARFMPLCTTAHQPNLWPAAHCGGRGRGRYKPVELGHIIGDIWRYHRRCGGDDRFDACC